MSKSYILYFLLLCIPCVTFSQISIVNNDDIVRVHKNDTVNIQVDYAFIVPPNKASLINNQLEQLVTVKGVYKNLKDNRNNVLSELNSTEKQLRKLLNRLKNDDTNIDLNLNNLLEKIDTSVKNLNITNSKLKSTNLALQNEVRKLKKINTDLKKISRGIWWSGFLDKTVMLVTGVALGLLISSI